SRSEAGVPDVLLQPRSCTAQADPRPAPRCVDVVGQRDREPRSARVDDAELATQSLQRRIERIEIRPLGTEAAVLVPRAGIPLLDPREVEEAFGNVVPLGAFAALDSLPRVCVVWQIVTEADIGCPDRIQHPPGTTLDRRGNHRSALRRTRARWTARGFGSSRPKTASAYGGRWSAGRSPGSSVIAQ